MGNFTPIIPKYNDQFGVTPNPEELAYGELAINIADGNLYSKKTDDTIVNINTGLGGSLVVDWDNLVNKPSDFTPSSHSHPISEITNLQTELDGKQPSGSYASSVHSHSPSDILGTAIVEGDSRLTDDRNPVAHNHGIDEILNLQSSLNNKADIYHTHNETGLDGNINGSTGIGTNALEYIKNNSIVNSSLNTTAVGYNALQNSYAENNTAVGAMALESNESGINNSAFGESALNLNESGTRNVAMGVDAGYNITTGNGNVAIGFSSANLLTTGFGNTIIGNYTARQLTVGSDNTVIGKDIVFTSGLINGSIALGAYASVVRNNELVLGSTTASLITSSTVGSSGSAATLPTQPLGYLEVRLNGTVVKIPYYNES